MKHLIEKVLSSRQVYKGRFLKVQQDEIITSDGKKGVREYILHPGAALVVPLLTNGKVVMVHQYRHAVKQVMLEFPAGKMDPGESSEQTAQRELQEEVGYKAGRIKFITKIHPVIGYADEHIDLYLAQDLTKSQQNLDADENLEVIEMDPAELMRLVFAGKVTDVKTQIAAFWLDKYLRGEWN
ncbi:MAG TPA: NUDIX hydrolase [Bdellovibrio sp.]|nr:NUDIX hydrolase [Bdellovibrio sp.]